MLESLLVSSDDGRDLLLDWFVLRDDYCHVLDDRVLVGVAPLTDGIVDREPLRKVGRDLSRHEICPLLLGHAQFAPDMRPNSRSISSMGCC